MDTTQQAILFILIAALFAFNLFGGFSNHANSTYFPIDESPQPALVGDITCLGHGEQTAFRIRLKLDNNGNIIPGWVGPDGKTVVGSAIGFHVQQNLYQSDKKFDYNWRQITSGSFEKQADGKYILYFQHNNPIQDGVFLQTFIAGGDHVNFLNGINSKIPWPKSILEYISLFTGERVRVENCGNI